MGVRAGRLCGHTSAGTQDLRDLFSFLCTPQKLYSSFPPTTFYLAAFPIPVHFLLKQPDVWLRPDPLCRRWPWAKPVQTFEVAVLG